MVQAASEHERLQVGTGSKPFQTPLDPVEALGDILNRVCVREPEVALAVLAEVNAFDHADVDFFQDVKGEVERVAR